MADISGIFSSFPVVSTTGGDVHPAVSARAASSDKHQDDGAPTHDPSGAPAPASSGVSPEEHGPRRRDVMNCAVRIR